MVDVLRSGILQQQLYCAGRRPSTGLACLQAGSLLAKLIQRGAPAVVWIRAQLLLFVHTKTPESPDNGHHHVSLGNLAAESPFPGTTLIKLATPSWCSYRHIFSLYHHWQGLLFVHCHVQTLHTGKAPEMVLPSKHTYGGSGLSMYQHANACHAYSARRASDMGCKRW